MENSDTEKSAWIRLRPEDNVGVLVRPVKPGETLGLGRLDIVVKSALGLGHKIALQAIPRGEKVIKYGFPIGSATQDIAVGEHVHVHNIKSDYLPTYTLEEGSEYHEKQH